MSMSLSLGSPELYAELYTDLVSPVLRRGEESSFSLPTHHGHPTAAQNTLCFLGYEGALLAQLGIHNQALQVTLCWAAFQPVGPEPGPVHGSYFCLGATLCYTSPLLALESPPGAFHRGLTPLCWTLCFWSQLFEPAISSASFLSASLRTCRAQTLSACMWRCYGRQYQKPSWSQDKQNPLLSPCSLSQSSHLRRLSGWSGMVFPTQIHVDLKNMIPNHVLVVSGINCSNAFPDSEVRQTDLYFPGSCLVLLEDSGHIWFLPVLRNLPHCNSHSVFVKSGLAMTAASSLSIQGCIPPRSIDSHVSNLFKCFLTWSFSPKGKSSWLQSFPWFLGIWGCWRQVCPVKAKTQMAALPWSFPC